MSFSTFSFDRRIDAGIKCSGYSAPTPIQQQAIPLIMKGRDVMGLAQTGTGKTAAFALPILQRLLGRKTPGKAPSVLVLAPTRELAIQINDSFKLLASETYLRSSVIMGGVGMAPQIRDFGSSHIVVACPGRLLRLMSMGRVTLGAIDTLVLDEADRMLDMGFMPDIKRIIAKLPAQRQNLLFSATMPKEIASLAGSILVDPETVSINTEISVEGIKHIVHQTESSKKIVLLDSIIDRSEHRNMLIFTSTKHKAKKLARQLEGKGHAATFLQGNMSQKQREHALNGFREGRFSIMVATDIVARGIDCERITHVINYDMPDTVETYTHRIGRTGRAGRTGEAISLATREDNVQVRDIERVMNVTVEKHTSPGFESAPEAAGPKTAGSVRRPGSKPSGKRAPQRKSSERRSTERCASERNNEARPSKRRNSETRSSERRSSEDSPSERRTSERRTSENRNSDRRRSDRRSSERRGSENRTSERRNSEWRAPETRTSERRTSETRNSENRSSDRRPAGSRPSRGPRRKPGQRHRSAA
ncbi:DEAD/DEAH box helicase [Maridesulfovibrio sp. FT414]|uniref:DEAD/DEAH box helicase n=1 Tax=Maridesulfovibrio sp. FT414 TaxID=2979469 RepID=UPI003D800977